MKKPRKISYQLIPEDERPEMYDLLNELIGAYHDHLATARIALAWCYSWKPDPDGRMVLGKCKKASDLDRQLHDRDFVILLHAASWDGPEFTALHRRALLDHELCHADVVIDPESGDPVLNEAGRQVFRIRKHDLEEFRCVVDRHGLWKSDIEEFAKVCAERSRTPLFNDEDEKPVGLKLVV